MDAMLFATYTMCCACTLHKNGPLPSIHDIINIPNFMFSLKTHPVWKNIMKLCLDYTVIKESKSITATGHWGL
jgi:hypothetical protein